MENFFVDDNFYHDFEDFLRDIDIEDKQDALETLPDGQTFKIGLTNLEPIFKIDKKTLEELVSSSVLEHLFDNNEDRYSENEEVQEKEIKKAFIKAFNLDEFNKNLPKLYYPSGEMTTISKDDILKHFD